MKITELSNAVDEAFVQSIQSIFTESFNQPPSDNFLERLSEKKDLSILIATERDQIIGFKIGYTKYKGVFFSWLGAVKTSHRRLGVARELLKMQHKLCVERGYKEIQTEAKATNSAMLILNLKEGFEVSGMHLGHEDKLTVQLRKLLH